jgi:hypothetical protein
MDFYFVIMVNTSLLDDFGDVGNISPRAESIAYKKYEKRNIETNTFAGSLKISSQHT